MGTKECSTPVFWHCPCPCTMGPTGWFLGNPKTWGSPALTYILPCLCLACFLLSCISIWSLGANPAAAGLPACMASPQIRVKDEARWPFLLHHQGWQQLGQRSTSLATCFWARPLCPLPYFFPEPLLKLEGAGADTPCWSFWAPKGPSVLDQRCYKNLLWELLAVHVHQPPWCVCVSTCAVGAGPQLSPWLRQCH
jgi:hypothetical protein